MSECRKHRYLSDVAQCTSTGSMFPKTTRRCRSRPITTAILFDGNTAEARMMGMEYIISEKLYSNAARRREGILAFA